MHKKNQSILIVDDTESNIDILLELLVGYDVIVSMSGEGALDILASEKIDLVLLDIMMVGMDGFEVCEKIRQNPKMQHIPIVFITAKTDENSIEKAYDSGGNDYITKPFKPKELMARIKTQLKMQDLVQHLHFLASRDSMTGIYNRRKFFELSLKLFEEKNDLYAVMIDIDKFKSINDLYGHPFGDRVIKSVTRAIGSFLEEDMIFGRLGGEEFALLLEARTKEEVVALCEALRSAVESLEFAVAEKKPLACTISTGIAHKQAWIQSLDHLLKEADDALYEAKKEGRNKVVYRVERG
ncbi:MAG: diguanylate cyclase [Sulfurimonadaceae bacterium]